MGFFNLDKTYHVLLIALAFLLPLTVFGANLVIVIICALWLLTGDYKLKIRLITNNRLILISILFFCMHILGLLWTEDLSWGLHIVHKMWYFIGLFPILYTIAKKDYFGSCISAFLLAILISTVISYLIWFQIIEPFKYASQINPTPFMSHISYNPILAFAIYLVSHKVLFDRNIHLLSKYLYSFFALSMVTNMFITGGRTGQVMFFLVLALLIFQYFRSSKIKALIVTFIISSLIFFIAYQSSEIFHQRATNVISNIKNYDSDKKTGVGLRIAFAVNSFELISKNPIIGVGTGDFPKEYKKINLANTPELPDTSNPHNMYILVLTQLGIIGLISFLMIFYYQIKYSFYSKNKLIRDLGITLPLVYLLIMFSDSYLLGHYTSLLFIFFSSFLYKDFEKG